VNSTTFCNLSKAHESVVVRVISTQLAVFAILLVTNFANAASAPEPDLSNHPLHSHFIPIQ
jgi:hypothetical protein